jgi:TRAP-type C4-dicarboxylate transport system substrate-binding protein
MPISLSRRVFIVATLAATLALPAFGQEGTKLRFSAVFSDKDIRAGMMQRFAEAIGPDLILEPYFGGNLFKQGTELVALQRGNLEMGNIAPQDIANQVPEFSILTAAYVFRDADHMRAFYASDFGREMVGRAEAQLGIKILGPTYFGTRQVGLKPETEIRTPEDMAGIKLRMPGGDAWQFLGRALGANPTPMAYAEVYTGLQTGAIDGQDNPLPNVENMKFYEVMSQIVLTGHLVGYDLLTISKTAWDSLTPEQQEKVQAAATAAIDWSQAEHLKMEGELAKSFEERGLKVSTPDVEAFRAHAQKMYLESDLAKSWPEGMLDKINGLGA